MRIEILDTTLRDGAQAERVVFSIEDKIKIIRALDKMGVDFIEAGNPGASPKDAKLFEFARDNIALENSRLAAFGMTCRAGAKAEEDAQLLALAACGAGVVSLVGKACAFQVREVLRVPLEENLRMVSDSIRFLTEKGIRVFFDAEHFFDGFARDEEYAMDVLAAALKAGAERLILCDTNGGTLPETTQSVVEKVCSRFGNVVGIHTHNDSGLATACTMFAVRGGAVQVQGTINGYGERCGNANLCTVIPNLALKMGYDVLLSGNLTALSGTARFVADIANLQMDEKTPYVGDSAFAHKAGMHIDGVMKNPATFEHVLPEDVGNHRRYLLSEQSGRGALMLKLKQIAPDIDRDSPEVANIVNMLKKLEADGYAFEDADASLELRILGALGRRREFFRVIDFNVVCRKPEDEKNSQAYVKIGVGNQVEITADEGNGPVDALDRALKKALLRFYPLLGGVRLVDLKVRVVEDRGTESSVRFMMESTDGKRVWSTVGYSSNIIEASFIALSDSIEYLLMLES
ncbi:MAG: citramalate synthase [Clostridiales bacterium]|nr:citramalate synthase [Clostridiales bacterium]